MINSILNDVENKSYGYCLSIYINIYFLIKKKKKKKGTRNCGHCPDPLELEFDMAWDTSGQ